VLNETDIWVVRKGYLHATEGRMHGFTAGGEAGHRFVVDRVGGGLEYENLEFFG